MAWKRERLESVARDRIGGAKLVVVANREAYCTFDGEEIRCSKPASGLTTALDPVMRTCGGTWVAHGAEMQTGLSATPSGVSWCRPISPHTRSGAYG